TDATPAHVGDVEQAVDATEIDERAVLGDVLDGALHRHPLGQRLEGLRLHLVALALEEHAAREHDVAALLVELDDLEFVGLADELIEISNRPEIHLRSGQEGLHAAADGDREAALHALADGPFDELVRLAGVRDLIPDLHLVGLLFRQGDEAVVVLAALDVDVHLVAGLDLRLAAGISEFAERDDALALAADVDDDVIAADLDDGPCDYFSFA